MRWASVSPGERAHLSASAFAHGRAVVGLAAGVAPRAFARARGLRVTTVLARLRAIQVAASPAALAALARAPGSPRPLRRAGRPPGAGAPARRPADLAARPGDGPPLRVGVPSGRRRHVALNLAGGDSRILVGVVDSGITPVADLRGRWPRRSGTRTGTSPRPTPWGTARSSRRSSRPGTTTAPASAASAAPAASPSSRRSPRRRSARAAGISALTDAHVRIINLGRHEDRASLEHGRRRARLCAGGRACSSWRASGNEGERRAHFPASRCGPRTARLPPG